MIGKSDLVILGVATVALTVGVARWYTNTRAVDSVTIPASARSSIEADRVANNDRSRFTGFVHVADVAGSNNEALQMPSPQSRTQSNAGQSAVDEDAGASSASNSDNADRNQTRFGVHTVQSGDYLGLLANRYDTTVSELQTLNGIDGTTIRVGQELRYPQTVQ